MKNVLRAVVLSGLSLLAPPPLLAAVVPAQIAADANWVVYADLNTIRSSVLGKDLMTILFNHQMEKTGGLLALNVPKVLETIGSITAYGTCGSEVGEGAPKEADFERAALLIQGTPNLKKIAEALLIQQSVEKPEEVVELKEFPYAAYGIKHKFKESGKDDQVIVAFPPEPVVVISKSKAQLTKALEVFRGAGDSLEKASNPALGRLIKDAGDVPLFGASTMLSPKAQNADYKSSRIFKLASAGLFALGEKGENTAAKVMLVASTEETAGKLLKIVQGMAAILSLAESSDKQLTEFLNSVVVERQAATVTLDLSYPSVRASQLLKNIQQVQASKALKAKPESSNAGKKAEKFEGEITK